jgi:hypothetical protein
VINNADDLYDRIMDENDKKSISGVSSEEDLDYFY